MQSLRIDGKIDCKLKKINLIGFVPLTLNVKLLKNGALPMRMAISETAWADSKSE